nr:MAG TPA: hypothetical protein [Caudoviricetes sp.]
MVFHLLLQTLFINIYLLKYILLFFDGGYGCGAVVSNILCKNIGLSGDSNLF